MENNEQNKRKPDPIAMHFDKMMQEFAFKLINKLPFEERLKRLMTAFNEYISSSSERRSLTKNHLLYLMMQVVLASEKEDPNLTLEKLHDEIQEQRIKDAEQAYQNVKAAYDSQIKKDDNG